jgi:mannose-6-phosphate isomerase
MSELYPLKFDSILKETVWGGKTLAAKYNKKTEKANSNLGESWEISAVSGNISIVSNGFLAGNDLQELIEVYMGDITGDSVYEKFGNEFPLLIKFIEAHQDLSVQVHPGNELAKKRHKAYGKTEMWYILESEEPSKIYTGFRHDVTREIYMKAVEQGTVADLLNVESSRPGDCFFTPSGTVHAIGAGNILVEIQQTSDITYRIFDWNRNNKERELHTDLALDAIDFKAENRKISLKPETNKTVNLIGCEFFTTNLLKFKNTIKRDFYLKDTFVIYICTDGEFTIRYEDNEEKLKKGDTVLVPAMMKEFLLQPVGEATLLEIYIDEDVKYI